MEATTGVRPRFSTSGAARLARDRFFFETIGVTELPSERDRNFLLEGRNGEARVLKIARAGEDRALLELQNDVLDLLQEVGVPVGRRLPAEARHLEAAHAERKRREKADRSRPEDGGAPRPPDLETPLELVGLDDALLDHGRRLEENADVLRGTIDIG